MLTIDDKQARAALIRTHDQLLNPHRWMSASYHMNCGNPLCKRVARCMMGEVGFQTKAMSKTGKLNPFEPLYASIHAWFCKELDQMEEVRAGSPEVFNDKYGYEAVMAFLVARINDLDQQLLRDAPPPEEPIKTGLSPRSMLGVLVDAFVAYPQDRACVTPNLPERVR